jgi:hypothetical protein
MEWKTIDVRVIEQTKECRDWLDGEIEKINSTNQNDLSIGQSDELRKRRSKLIEARNAFDCVDVNDPMSCLMWLAAYKVCPIDENTTECENFDAFLERVEIYYKRKELIWWAIILPISVFSLAIPAVLFYLGDWGASFISCDFTIIDSFFERFGNLDIESLTVSSYLCAAISTIFLLMFIPYKIIFKSCEATDNRREVTRWLSDSKQYWIDKRISKTDAPVNDNEPIETLVQDRKNEEVELSEF